MRLRHWCSSLLVVLLGACVLVALFKVPGFIGMAWWTAVVTVGAIVLFALWSLVDLWRRG